MAEVLLVEDNPGDVVLTKQAFTKSTRVDKLHVVDDGAEALDFLYRRGNYADATRPDLILLDINLPRVNGHEFLAQVKQDADLRRIPIVVLTSSDRQADIDRAYDAHANGYLTKPASFQDLVSALDSLERFWFDVARGPSKH